MLVPSRPPPKTILGPKFEEALAYCCELHRQQSMKGSETPYIAHLLGVTSIALRHGATETEAIAALLHDAVEDAGGPGTRDEIRRRFGDEAAEIVDACSDTDQEPKPPWRPRKERYLEHLPQASRSALLVSASDKLFNARSIVEDLRVVKDVVWSRFAGGKEGTLWYYRALVGALRSAPGAPARIVAELALVVEEMERLAG